LLSAREHTRAELLAKLQPHEQVPGELAAVLDELLAKGFLNEARVVQSVVHRRAARLGTQRVRAELLAKGLPTSLVDEAVDELRQTEEARARVVWQRKFGAVAGDVREQARQMRFLAGRGFSAAVIRRVVRETGSEDEGL
jgi:regulatory protein